MPVLFLRKRTLYSGIVKVQVIRNNIAYERIVMQIQADCTCRIPVNFKNNARA